MKKEEFLKSKAFKILLLMAAILIGIGIWRNGYQFGQWLHEVLN